MITVKKNDSRKCQNKYSKNGLTEYPYSERKKVFFKDELFLSQILEKMKNTAITKEVEEEYELYYGE